MGLSDVSENTKKQLRKTFLAQRAHLSLSGTDQKIIDVLEAWPLFRSAGRILCYYPFRGEIDLTPLMEAHPEKAWALPVVQPDGGMTFHAYAFGDPLRNGKYGILEPEPTAAPVETIDANTLIFTPGVAFDRRGYRLGYGKGYYDRFMASLLAADTHPVAIGVIPEALLCNTLPTDPWDAPMHFIATESGLYKPVV